MSIEIIETNANISPVWLIELGKLLLAGKNAGEGSIGIG